VLPIGDKYDDESSMCVAPEATENGVTIPKCLKMIGVDDVVKAVRRFLP
jgi:hypothetical protein